LSDAWASDSPDLARRLKTLIQWLVRNGEESAAATLREEPCVHIHLDLTR